MALGCLSEDRGSDSAGVAWQVGDRLRVAKVAKNPLVAYPVDLAPAIRHAAKYHGALIGHTRQATQGAVTSRNAHPFLDDKSKIAWAHNGVIINDRDFGNFEVDSECLIGGIQKRNFEPYHGPIALLWIEDGKLHAFRKTNPLYRGTKRGAVYMASEEGMLTAIGCHRIKSLSEGFIYSWDQGNLVGTTKVPVYRYKYTAYEKSSEPYWNKYEARGDYYSTHRHWKAGQWHNHVLSIEWDQACQACNPGGEAVQTSDTGPTRTELVPITSRESLIDKVEGEEAARMMQEENLCFKCAVAPRAGASSWCDECLGMVRGGD